MMLFVGLLFIIYGYLNHLFYKNKRFDTSIQIITALSTLLVALGIVYQAKTGKDQRDDARMKLYLGYPKNYLNSINQIFMDHPDMDYYYKELFEQKYESVHRNVMMESYINNAILTTTMEQVSIIKYTDGLDPFVFEKSIHQMISFFFKSPTLKQYYIDQFKPKFANQTMKRYIKTHFNF
jgi:hypothetical protein